MFQLFKPCSLHISRTIFYYSNKPQFLPFVPRMPDSVLIHSHSMLEFHPPILLPCNHTMYPSYALYCITVSNCKYQYYILYQTVCTHTIYCIKLYIPIIYTVSLYQNVCTLTIYCIKLYVPILLYQTHIVLY